MKLKFEIARVQRQASISAAKNWLKTFRICAMGSSSSGAATVAASNPSNDHNRHTGRSKSDS